MISTMPPPTTTNGVTQMPVTHDIGTLTLARKMAANPSSYTVSQLQDAMTRLLAAKHRSRHSERAQYRAQQRLDAIRTEIATRLGQHV